MIERIKTILAVKNLSSAQFATEIGVQRSGISHILSGRNKPSLDFVLKILDHYPNINEIWLLKGQGEMYKNQASDPTLFEKPDQSMPVAADDEINPADHHEKIPETTAVEEEAIEKQEQSPVMNKSKQIEEIMSTTGELKMVKLIAIYENNSFEVYKPK